MRTLVFTDLDGTLLDHSYSWGGAKATLAELRRRQVPVILCTSKTRAEVKALQTKLGNGHPYAVENGGLVIVPRGYFGQALMGGGRRSELIFRLGSKDYAEVVEALVGLAQACGISVRGFHQMSASELARESGLSVQNAKLAKRRESGEAFQFRDATTRQIKDFLRRAKRSGYAVARGGRFWHFSAGGDKGQAVELLACLYRLAWGTPFSIVALGDAGNDLPMLRRADLPILLSSPDGHFDPVVTKKLPHVRRLSRISPESWSSAVLQAVNEFAAANGLNVGHPLATGTQRDSGLRHRLRRAQASA